MDYKAIRFLAFFSIVLSAVFLTVWIWYRFGSGGSTESPAMAQSMWFVLLIVGSLAERVASVLERQADEIAALRRLVAEQPESRVGL